MKKLRNISVVALFLTWLSAGAMEVEKEGVSLNGDQTLVVELTKVSEGTLISFEDQKGVVLFKDNLLIRGNYNKTLNLEMIPQGTYLLKVDKRFATKVWKIKKSSHGVEILGNSSTINFKPNFSIKDSRVVVFMTNPAENTIGLLVQDQNGEILADLKDAKGIFLKTLDFSNVPKGEYYVTVSKGKERFTEKVVLN